MGCNCGKSVVTTNTAMAARQSLPRESTALVTVRVLPASTVSYNGVQYKAGDTLQLPANVARNVSAVQVLG